MPNVAMEAHKEAIDRVVDEALAKAGITASQLDAVAVTVGPGLALCLRVSCSSYSRDADATLLLHMPGVLRGIACQG